MNDNQKAPVCNNHEDLVSYLYGEATPEQARRLEAHLAGCTRCDEELAAFRRVRSALGEWELNDMPIMRVALPPQRKSTTVVLRELFGVAPMWAKAFSGLAAAMLVLAVMGTEVNIGRDGFSFKSSLIGRRASAVVQQIPNQQPQTQPMTADEIKAFVNKQILESERAQKEQMSAQLAKMETGLKNAHSNDFAKLKVRVQEQRDLIKTLERDIDRRAGMGLDDILFSSNGGDRSRRTSDVAEGGQ
jgi:hypothetical protein